MRLQDKTPPRNGTVVNVILGPCLLRIERRTSTGMVLLQNAKELTVNCAAGGSSRPVSDDVIIDVYF